MKEKSKKIKRNQKKNKKKSKKMKRNQKKNRKKSKKINRNQKKNKKKHKIKRNYSKQRQTKYSKKIATRENGCTAKDWVNAFKKYRKVIMILKSKLTISKKYNFRMRVL